MKSKTKSLIGILMGIIIAIADIYWTYTSSYVAIWVILGVIILIADLVWLYIDYNLMKK